MTPAPSPPPQCQMRVNHDKKSTTIDLKDGQTCSIPNHPGYTIAISGENVSVTFDGRTETIADGQTVQTTQCTNYQLLDETECSYDDLESCNKNDPPCAWGSTEVDVLKDTNTAVGIEVRVVPPERTPLANECGGFQQVQARAPASA